LAVAFYPKWGIFRPVLHLLAIKTEENRKIPVETGEKPLTFRAKTPNVNFGTLAGTA